MKNDTFRIGDLLELEKQGYCINFRNGMVESIFKPGDQEVFVGNPTDFMKKSRATKEKRGAH